MTTTNQYGEAIDPRAIYARNNLGTISQIVKFLKTVEAKEEGVEIQEFARAGYLPPMAVVQELRRRGYEVETFDEDERCRLLAVPSVGSRKRRADQTQLFDPRDTLSDPRDGRQHSPYEDAG